MVTLIGILVALSVALFITMALVGLLVWMVMGLIKENRTFSYELKRKVFEEAQEVRSRLESQVYQKFQVVVNELETVRGRLAQAAGRTEVIHSQDVANYDDLVRRLDNLTQTVEGLLEQWAVDAQRRAEALKPKSKSTVVRFFDDLLK